MKAIGQISFFFVLGFACFAHYTGDAQARSGGSTITFGRSDQLTTKAGKKRNFRQDIEAVNKAHEGWKKAHLNPTLYACQRNSERIALLARKVSDRLEASKKDAVASAKAACSSIWACRDHWPFGGSPVSPVRTTISSCPPTVACCA